MNYIALGFGIFCAATIIKKVAHVHKILAELNGQPNWWNTVSFMWFSCLLLAEQHLKQSIKFDPARRAYVISFFMKNELYQLVVKPPTGPQNKNILKTPLQRGYEALVLEQNSTNKWETKPIQVKQEKSPT